MSPPVNQPYWRSGGSQGCESVTSTYYSSEFWALPQLTRWKLIKVWRRGRRAQTSAEPGKEGAKLSTILPICHVTWRSTYRNISSSLVKISIFCFGLSSLVQEPPGLHWQGAEGSSSRISIPGVKLLLWHSCGWLVVSSNLMPSTSGAEPLRPHLVLYRLPHLSKC